MKRNSLFCNSSFCCETNKTTNETKTKLEEEDRESQIKANSTLTGCLFWLLSKGSQVDEVGLLSKEKSTSLAIWKLTFFGFLSLPSACLCDGDGDDDSVVIELNWIQRLSCIFSSHKLVCANDLAHLNFRRQRPLFENYSLSYISTGAANCCWFRFYGHLQRFSKNKYHLSKRNSHLKCCEFFLSKLTKIYCDAPVLVASKTSLVKVIHNFVRSQRHISK